MAGEPGIHNPYSEYGFRACAPAGLRRPERIRNDELVSWARRDAVGAYAGGGTEMLTLGRCSIFS
jgi:hypothetical protein